MDLVVNLMKKHLDHQIINNNNLVNTERAEQVGELSDELFTQSLKQRTAELPTFA